MEEINSAFCEVPIVPTFKCDIFEDNTAAVEIANVPKIRPRTRHIIAAYHHFRCDVAHGRLKVLHISTLDQEADILTKAVDEVLMTKHRK